MESRGKFFMKGSPEKHRTLTLYPLLIAVLIPFAVQFLILQPVLHVDPSTQVQKEVATQDPALSYMSI